MYAEVRTDQDVVATKARLPKREIVIGSAIALVAVAGVVAFREWKSVSAVADTAVSVDPPFDV